jgi:hypothetical protein
VLPGNGKKLAMTTVLRVAMSEAARKVRAVGPKDGVKERDLAVRACNPAQQPLSYAFRPNEETVS